MQMTQRYTLTSDNRKDSEVLQEDLDNLSKWSERWQLRFNVDKCGIMHYGKQVVKTTYNVEGGGYKKIP